MVPSVRPVIRLAATAAFAALAAAAAAAPQLKPQPELVADGALKLRVLAQAQGLPPPTPESRTAVWTRGAESRTVRLYRPADLWRVRAIVGTWKDRRGNVMHLASVKSPLPDLGDREFVPADDIAAALDAAEKAFDPTADDLAAWTRAWGADVGRHVTAKDGARYFIGFTFAEKVSPAAAEKLLKDAAASLSTKTSGVSANNTSMRWWSEENGQYRFLTDLDRAKGGRFVADAMKLIGAMRKAYESYVPANGTVAQGTVRVFRTLAGYRDYRLSTGENDTASCGLWDPNREELLISAEDRVQAQDTMRHEAFHQYLHYATGRGDHALWFNEGHACFFENVKYNPARDAVTVTDEGGRAYWTAKNPAAVAAAIRPTLAMSREEFYSGDRNLHYVTAWAIVYFLEKGAYAADEFEPYRGIVSAYLAGMASGASAEDATRTAWAAVADRDIKADFLKFWTKYRRQALSAR